MPKEHHQPIPVEAIRDEHELRSLLHKHDIKLGAQMAMNKLFQRMWKTMNHNQYKVVESLVNFADPDHGESSITLKFHGEWIKVKICFHQVHEKQEIEIAQILFERTVKPVQPTRALPKDVQAELLEETLPENSD